MASTSRYLNLLEIRSSGDPDCYICLQIAQRKPVKQEGPTKTCLLCNNPYCEKHKSDEDVCNMNHVTYFSKAEHRARHAPVEIFPNVEARRRIFGEEEGNTSINTAEDDRVKKDHAAG